MSTREIVILVAERQRSAKEQFEDFVDKLHCEENRDRLGVLEGNCARHESDVRRFKDLVEKVDSIAEQTLTAKAVWWTVGKIFVSIGGIGGLAALLQHLAKGG